MPNLIKLRSKKLYLCLLAIFLLFLFKLTVVSDGLLITTTTIFEGLIFFLILAFTAHLKERALWWKITNSTLFYSLFFFHLTLSFIYTYYLDEVVDRSLSLVRLNWGATTFFFTHILPLRVIFYYFLLVSIFLIIIFLVKKKEFILKKIPFFSLLSLTILLLFAIPLANTNFSVSHFSSPYLNTLEEIKIYLIGEKIILQPLEPTEKDFSFLKRPPPQENPPPYDRILFFVIEGLSYKDFLKDIQDLPPDNFFQTLKPHTHYYSNYFTNNQDSRTAVMAMLSSTFVPFEAYTHQNWLELYANKIKEKDNLVKYFNRHNYSTEFMISSVETPVVSRVYPWSKIHHLNEEQYNEDEEFICLHIMEYQHGCEDEIILPDLKQTLLNSSKLFLFQEMVYGHGRKYLTLKKQSLTEYYNNYFLKVHHFLKQNNLWENTLIVILSDHGPKDRGRMITKYGYHIPLLTINKGFDYATDETLYSHLDLKDILFGTQKPSPFVFFVGSTRSSLIGYVDRGGHYAVVQGDRVVGRDWLYDQLGTEQKISLFRQYEKLFTLGLV